jgi:large subunit ribosomal protein L29
MKATELRDLSVTELNARLNDERAEMQEMKFQKAVTGQLENPSEITEKKRLVARILTVLSEKESAN